MRAAPIGSIVRRVLAATALWWVLAGARPDGWGVGMVAVVGACAASLVLMPPGAGRISLTGLVAFAGFFVVESLRAGVQVAAMALRRDPDLRPAVRTLTLRLPAGPARTLLVNTMSLLPGTLSAGLTGERLCLHVLDARLPVEQGLRALEARVAGMFGLTLKSRPVTAARATRG